MNNFQLLCIVQLKRIGILIDKPFGTNSAIDNFNLSVIAAKADSVLLKLNSVLILEVEIKSDSDYDDKLSHSLIYVVAESVPKGIKGSRYF